MSNHPTDDELERDWQPNGRRPQSTIARSFSQELVDIFRLENSVSELDSDLDKRKQQVSTQTSELQALEARIKEMEARLGKGQPSTGASGTQGQQRPAVGNTFDQASTAAGADKTSRPGTAKPQQQAPIRGGALPPTPTASEDGGDRDN